MKLHVDSEALLSEPGHPLPGSQVDRPSGAVTVDEKFDSRNAPRQFSRQYAHSYAVRLWSVRPRLEEKLKTEWPGVELKKIAELCEFSQAKTSTKQNTSKARTSDDHGQHIAFREDITVAVVGTVFKYQPEKPSILQELAEDNPMVPVVPKTKFTSAQDTIQLEDETTRVQLVLTEECGISVGSLVNGVICAVKGKPNINGKFDVSEVVFPTPFPKPVSQFKMDVEMIFVSGLEMQSEKSQLQVDILFDYLEGLVGCPSDIEDNLKNVAKVFFVGNTFASNTNADSGKDNMGSRMEMAKKLDQMFDQISQTMDVFILPGESDPSEPMLPQFPLHRCVFPLSARRPTFKTLPNPTRLNLLVNEQSTTGLDVILSSGQNVKDALRNSEIASPLEMCQQLLRWGHLCPTAPDTLPLHPGVEDDVFALESMPHVFAVGNQPSFDAMEWMNTKIFTIPKFSETGTVVILNKELELVPLNFHMF